MEYLGNQALLNLPKVAFLCSRKVPATAVLKCYDWAIAQRDAGTCVISGFHSQIEKDVFHFLAKGNQPIILVLARGMMIRLDSIFSSMIDQGRLLLISPFDNSIKRANRSTALRRNELMVQIAEKLVIGYAFPNGGIENTLRKTDKPVEFLVG